MSERLPTIKTVDIRYVAELLNCSPKTVLEKAGRGELRGAKFGKSWVFIYSDVLEYINHEIEKQTLSRQNRYRPQKFPTASRAYEQANFRKSGYPDLSAYHKLIKR